MPDIRAWYTGEKEAGELEAWTGIEPVYTDLQSAASPLRHQASLSWCTGGRKAAPADRSYATRCPLLSSLHAKILRGGCRFKSPAGGAQAARARRLITRVSSCIFLFAPQHN